MLTARERAAAHYRAAKEYMRYGDTLKSKAHLKRALHYGSDEETALRDEINKAAESALEPGAIEDLLVKTFRFIRNNMITSDPDQSKKRGVKQTTAALTTAKIENFGELEITKPDTSERAKLFFTKPRSLYAFKDGKLTNGSMGPNLMDLNNTLAMSSAFSGGVDYTHKVHTNVREAIEESDSAPIGLQLGREQIVKIALNIHMNASEEAYESANKAANEVSSDSDGLDKQHHLRRVAAVMHAFWENAYALYCKGDTDKSRVRVLPLAHATTSGEGYATFQLLVTFEDTFLRKVTRDVINHIQLTAALAEGIKGYRPRDARDTKTELLKLKWTPLEETKAWMAVLVLLLDGAKAAKKDGGYYTLEWKRRREETEADYRTTGAKTVFGRTYR